MMKKTNLKETLKQIVGVLLFGYVCIAEAVSTGCKKLRTLPKKVMAVCIAAALIVAMIPVAVFAVGTHTNHCICGKTHKVVGDHTAEQSVEWTAWDASASSNYQTTLPTSGTYYLTDNVTLSSQHTVNGKLTICLNGNTISFTATTGSVIQVPSGSTFELTDCSATAGQITGGKGYKYSYFQASGGGVHNDGTFTMYGGIIAGNTAANGGGVYNAGTFTMYDGTIGGQTENAKNCATIYGGGVYNYSGTFVMNGGTIIGNSASSFGGGVCNYNNGTFTMTGGTITENMGANGGGVYNSGTFTMENSTVSGNTAGSDGGGVYNYGTLKLAGNIKIKDNNKGNEGNLAPNNIFLTLDKRVTVAGALTCEDASIGVTMQSYNVGTFTTGGAAYIDKFVSDSSTYGIAVDGENLALKFQYTVTFDYGTLGSETKTVFKDETVTPPTPVFAGKVLVGWYKDKWFYTEFNFSDAITNTTTTVYAKFADYEGDKTELNNKIDAAKAELQGKIDAVNSALAGKADAATVNAAIANLQAAIAALEAVKDDYATADTALKTELEGKIADAQTAAISAAETLVNNAKTELQSKIDEKANTADVNAAIANLQASIAALEAVKDDYATADATLKTELEGKIADAQTAAISAAETLVNNAKTELQSKIDAKADAATTTVAIQNLQAAVAALEAVKDDYAAADTALKTELEGKISAAQTATISAAETLVNNAKTELQSKIDAKADAATTTVAIQNLQAAVAALEAVKDDYATADATLKTELEGKIETAKSEAITAANTALTTAKNELSQAIALKADTATLNAKVDALNAAIANAESVAKAYADTQDAALKAELQTAIANAKSEAISAAQLLVDNAKAELQTAIDTKADTATVNAAIANLQNAITALEAAKDNYASADAALKLELEAAIERAKQEAIEASKGYIPYIGTNGNWWIGDTDTGVDANGIKGDKGDKGDTGADGVGIAKIEKTATNGNVDTYTVTLTNGKTYTFTVTNGKDGANGKDGENGKDGADGKDGLTPFIGENGNWWIGETDTGVKAAADDSIPVGSGNVTEAEGVNTVTVVAIVIASLALLGNVLLAVLVLKKKKSLV